MKHFLITGTGHCGTAWMARAMTWMGYPCGHEWVYWWDEDRAGERWFGLQGDSSWAAAGYFHEIPMDWPVLHLMRDPLKVVASLYGSKFFHDYCECHDPFAHRLSPYGLFTERQLPALWKIEDPLSRAIKWVVDWNEHIQMEEQFRPIRKERIEDLSHNPFLLMDTVHYLTEGWADYKATVGVQAVLSPDINAHERAPLTWDDVMRNPLGHHLRRLAIENGYGGPDET